LQRCEGCAASHCRMQISGFSFRFYPCCSGGGRASRVSRVSQKRRVLTPAHPAHPAHPGWRVSRSHARKSDIFPFLSVLSTYLAEFAFVASNKSKEKEKKYGNRNEQSDKSRFVIDTMSVATWRQLQQNEGHGDFVPSAFLPLLRSTSREGRCAGHSSFSTPSQHRHKFNFGFPQILTLQKPTTEPTDRPRAETKRRRAIRLTRASIFVLSYPARCQTLSIHIAQSF